MMLLLNASRGTIPGLCVRESHRDCGGAPRRLGSALPSSSSSDGDNDEQDLQLGISVSCAELEGNDAFHHQLEADVFFSASEYQIKRTDKSVFEFDTSGLL